MLRSIFVLILTLAGAANAVRAPLGALGFYLWLAYFRPESWMWDPTLVATLRLSLVSGVVLVLRAFPNFFSRPLNLRSALLVLFMAFAGLSSAASGAPDAVSWDRWVEFAKCIGVTYLIFSIGSEDADKYRTILLVMAYSLGFEAAKQGYAGLILNPGGVNANSLPQLGDNNGVAVGMLMLAPVFAALAATTSRRWEKRMHQFFMLGIVARAITTHSRGAFLAAGVLALIYVLRSQHRVRALVGAAVMGTIILSVMPDTFWDRMETINVESEDQLDESAAGRLHFWRVAREMASARPLQGVGYNAYNWAYDDYDFSNGFYGRRRSVHSMWFGVLAELGYPGITLFALIFGCALVATHQVITLAKKGQLRPAFHQYGLALQSSLFACMVGGAFVPFQYTEMMWHFFGLTMGLRYLAMAHASGVLPAPAAVPSAPMMPATPLRAR